MACTLAGLLVTAGCIASTGTEAQLSASEGSSDLVLYLVLEDGQFTRTEAWWADEAPELSVDLDSTAHAYEAIVLKNDIVLTRGPLSGSNDEAVFVWRTSDAGAVAQAGDAFEILVVNATTSETVASYALEIQP